MGRKMGIHSHNFVETYRGLVGFGADRKIDENTVIYYLQKFPDYVKKRIYAPVAVLDGIFIKRETESMRSSSGKGFGRITSKPSF
jgi:hypothetical protein